VDYDTDDDGLIEVDSPAKLNAIRWDLNGDGMGEYGKAAEYNAVFPDAAAGMGCRIGDHDRNPSTPDQPRCHGYELTADLDFDTDGDVDSDDAFPNWIPIGSYKIGSRTMHHSYQAVFDGAGHTITRMKVRWSWLHGGLFASIRHDGVIRNLGMVDEDITHEMGRAEYARGGDGRMYPLALDRSGAAAGSNGGRVERSSPPAAGSMAGHR
jgi:hypothetical protein